VDLRFTRLICSVELTKRRRTRDGDGDSIHVSLVFEAWKGGSRPSPPDPLWSPPNMQNAESPLLPCSRCPALSLEWKCRDVLAFRASRRKPQVQETTTEAPLLYPQKLV